MKLLPLLIVISLAAPAVAQERSPSPLQAPAESHSGFARALLYGNTSGVPSIGKVVTIFTFHALTLGAVGAGTFLLVDRASEAKELKAAQAAGCSSPRDCVAQADRQDQLNRQSSLAAGAFALGGLALLSSVTTAFTWQNDDNAIHVTIAPTGAWATATF